MLTNAVCDMMECKRSKSAPGPCVETGGSHCTLVKPLNLIKLFQNASISKEMLVTLHRALLTG